MNKTYKGPSTKVSLYSPKFKRQSKSPSKLNTSPRDLTNITNDNIFQKVCCPNCRYLFKVITNQNLNTSRKYYERYYKQSKEEATQTMQPKNVSLSPSPRQSQRHTYTIPQSRVNKKIYGSDRKNSSIYDLQNSKRTEPKNIIAKQTKLLDRSQKKSSLTPSKLKGSNVSNYKVQVSPIKHDTKEVRIQNPKQISKSYKTENVQINKYIKELLEKNNLQNENKQLKLALEQLSGECVLPGYCKMLLQDTSKSDVQTFNKK